MGWGQETRRNVFNRQQGLCTICGQPLKGVFVLHHIKNRCQRGGNTEDNAEARHAGCEVYCHRAYRYGNPNGEYVVEVKKVYKPKKTRQDRRKIDYYRLQVDEHYAFKLYCQGRF